MDQISRLKGHRKAPRPSRLRGFVNRLRGKNLDRCSVELPPLSSTIDKENFVSNINTEEALSASPEKPKEKRVSLLNNEEASIPEKKPRKKDKKRSPLSPMPATMAPSLLVVKTETLQQPDRASSGESDSDLDRIRRELLSLREQLAASDSPCQSPMKERATKTIKKPKAKRKTKQGRDGHTPRTPRTPREPMSIM
jgi:hypothetical protein